MLVADSDYSSTVAGKTFSTGQWAIFNGSSWEDVVKTIETRLFLMFISRLSKQYRKIRKLDLRFNQALTKSVNIGFIFLADRVPSEQVSLYA
jgi:hypothetical protein